MNERTDYSIVIPCFNEQENVAKMARELLPVALQLAQGDLRVELLFVDDGSTDETLKALEWTFGSVRHPQLDVAVLAHGRNRGLGAAIRTGFQAARGEIIITTDSDGTYAFATMPDMLRLLTPGISIVTASPYHPGGATQNVPWHRLLLSRGSSFLYRLLVEWDVHTYTCLYRAYRREVVKRIPFESDGFLAGTELMVKAMLQGHRVAEYPAVLHARLHGVSKAKLVRTIKAHLRFQGQVLAARVGLDRAGVGLAATNAYASGEENRGLA